MSDATRVTLEIVDESLEKLRNTFLGESPNFSGDAPAPTTSEQQDRAIANATYAATTNALSALKLLAVEVERLSNIIDKKQ